MRVIRGTTKNFVVALLQFAQPGGLFLFEPLDWMLLAPACGIEKFLAAPLTQRIGGGCQIYPGICFAGCFPVST
jgi:hypothetical protein